MALFPWVKKTYYQVIYCRKPPGKVWRREVTVSNGAAMIVRAEILMPEDVNRLFEAGWSDSVYLHKGPMAVRGTLSACMFCDNTGVFMCCRCGKMFCVRAGWATLTCGICQGDQPEQNYVGEGFMPMSASGFLHAWGRFRVRRDGTPFSRGVMDLPPVDGEIVLGTVVEGTVIENQSLPSPAEQLPPPRPFELPSPEKDDARARLRKFLSDQRKPGEGEKP